jgi:ribonuclease HI
MECGRKIQKFPSAKEDFIKIFATFLDKLDDKEVQLCAVVARQLWALWHRRNGVVFEGELLHPTRMVHCAKEQLNNYEVAMASRKLVGRTAPETMEVIPRWKKPAEDVIKINWDASVDGRQTRIGVGVVVRDHAVHVLAILCDSKVAVTDLEGTEMLAVWQAVELCLQMGWQKIALEGDASEVVKSILNEESRGGRHGHIAQEVTERLQGIQEWRIAQIPSQANELAHSIAKLALSFMERTLWVGGYPPCTHEHVLTEQTLI